MEPKRGDSTLVSATGSRNHREYLRKLASTYGGRQKGKTLAASASAKKPLVVKFGKATSDGRKSTFGAPDSFESSSSNQIAGLKIG